ncbi:uncharacterized protein [Leuresthes tenuis]|uniref:uncharacterized protein n=1 Tax=Leuresthes tenuis TaxID=355514 RepID=UPI003B512BAA
MNYEQLDELCLGAELEVEAVPGPPEEAELRPTRKCSTARRVEKAEEEEERWRRLFPDIKTCTIVLERPRPEQLMAWKLKQWGRGSRVRSHDLRPGVDHLEPLEPPDGRSQSYVKKVEVRVQAEPAPDSGPERPRRRLCTDVTAGSAHQRPHDEENSHDFSNNLSTMDHTYCVEDSDTPDSNSQSQDTRPASGCGHKDEDAGCLSAEKKNPPSIVFKKVGGHQWVLSRPQVREEEEEEEEEMKKRKRTKDLMTEAPTPMNKIRRRKACGECAACLRNHCGACQFCRDMRRFGGPSKLKQKCVQRRCLVVNTRKAPIVDLPDGVLEEVTVTTATEPQLPHWRIWREGQEVGEKKRFNSMKTRPCTRYIPVNAFTNSSTLKLKLKVKGHTSQTLQASVSMLKVKGHTSQTLQASVSMLKVKG